MQQLFKHWTGLSGHRSNSNNLIWVCSGNGWDRIVWRNRPDNDEATRTVLLILRGSGTLSYPWLTHLWLT